MQGPAGGTGMSWALPVAKPTQTICRQRGVAGTQHRGHRPGWSHRGSAVWGVHQCCALGQRWAHTGVLYWGCAGDCWDLSGGSAGPILVGSANGAVLGAVLGLYWFAIVGAELAAVLRQCWAYTGGLYWDLSWEQC